MFWKKFTEARKEKKIYDKILELIGLMQIQISTLEANLELVNAKFKKKVYDQLPDPEKDLDPEEEIEILKHDDGLDRLRILNKEHGTTTYS